MAKTVFVGMSGGVDSSLSAALLKEQGYKVVGVFMKNWAQDLPGFKCPWREDLADAKRVAVQLGIPFKIYDFQAEYKQKVVDYMIKEFQAGRTPNPDITCNEEVKFKLFLETALADGADMIATGHYAQTKNGQLLRANDSNKDQTYFLYRVTEAALARTLFPLGELTKPQVRRMAKERGLLTASKKDSVGICFVGEIGIKDFLKNFVTTKPGDIIDQTLGQVVGRHEGALFYTIGQRHGLDLSQATGEHQTPRYVVGKNMAKNEVYVTTDLNHATLWRKEFEVTDLHWINEPPQLEKSNGQKGGLQVRTRHRAPLVGCKLLKGRTQAQLQVELSEEVRALTPGQSAVFYQDQVCLGGGIIV